MEESICWQLADMDHPPRLWLVMEQENLLINWETVQEVRASFDFLNLQFVCEFGLVTFSANRSLQVLFEYLQLEKVRRIDGRLLNCKIIT